MTDDFPFLEDRDAMPYPQPDNETRDEWMQRCIPETIRDGGADNGAQAYKICESKWEEATEEDNEDD